MVLVLFLFFIASVASNKTVPSLKCGVNEYAVPCKTICPPQNCDISYTSYFCDPDQKCIPGCDCIKDHLRNDEKICIFNENCPGPKTVIEEPTILPQTPKNNSEPHSTGNSQPSSQSGGTKIASSSNSSSRSSSSSHSSSSSYASSVSYSSSQGTGVPSLKCGVNEYAVPCKTICPPQNCDISYTSYFCDPDQKCIPGCDCVKDHLRNNEKICVFNENCPGPKTVIEEPTILPQPPKNNSEPHSTGNSQPSSQSGGTKIASSSNSSSRSSSSSHSSSSSYASSVSYSSSQGTGAGGPKRDCTYNRCTPTCSLPSPQNCPQDSNPCNCPPGTIISEEGGKCVQRQECQKYINCKGDYNATYTDCPIGCPSTCAKPNAEYCNTTCDKLGCACKPGYILNEKNGTCIKPDDCPGGRVCGKNEVFAYCSVTCPNNYCPTSDTRAIVACDPPYPCPSGCSCQRNHRRKSEKEYICIPASDCPPVNCTRQNEEWNPCPEPCFSDLCSARIEKIQPEDCPSYRRDCDPQCVCKHGFFRNSTDICVTESECPSNN